MDSGVDEVLLRRTVWKTASKQPSTDRNGGVVTGGGKLTLLALLPAGERGR